MYVDIHSHILPGIDDGAADTAEALKMLKLAANDWTRYIVATPHFTPGVLYCVAIPGASGMRNTPVIIHTKTDELARQAAFYNIDIKIQPGAEIMICPDIPDLLGKGDICSINGSRYTLVELPMDTIPSYTYEVLYEMQIFGLTPIIAHPERNNEVIKNISLVRDLIDRGILVQVNAGSLTGLFGRKVQKTAIKMIKSGFVHFVASDAHGCRGRTPQLGKAAEIVEKKFGIEKMQELFLKNGMAVLENKEIP